MLSRTRLQILALEDRTTPAFYEGFDAVTPTALPAGWTSVTAVGPAGDWQTAAGTDGTRYAAHTSKNYADVAQGMFRADKSLVSPVVAIPNAAGVQLKFSQTYYFYNFGTEDYFNGGVLEISIGGGAFTDIEVAGGTFAAGGYTGFMSGESLGAFYDNPLAGRTGWVGSTLGFANGLQWFDTVVNLPAAARGQNVQFRWRMGVTTLSTSGQGWYVDSVSVGLPPATLQTVSGGGQTAAANTTYAQPLRVRVLDTAGDPVGGAPVAFTAPRSGATHLVSFFRPGESPIGVLTVFTDADGYAQVTVRANGTAGAGDVTATTPGVGTTSAFTLTVTGGGTGGSDGVGYAVGAGRGGGPRVKVFDRANALRYDFFAYDVGFTGGVVVATGDLTGDGVRDIVTGPESGGGPHVKVFDGATGKEVRSFFAFDPAFAGGLTLAVGDVTGDAVIDIVVGAGPGGGPAVAAFDGKTGHIIRSFFAFDPGFRGGVSVAVGNGELVVAAGPGGGPHVRVFDQSSNTPVASFFAFDPAFAGGVNVTGMSSLFHTGEGIVAGQATGGSAVALFNKQGTRVGGEEPFGGFAGGARVAGTGLTLSDGPVLVEGAGPGGGPRVRGRRPAFTSDAQTAATFNEVFDFFPFEAAFRGGVNVG